MKNLWSRIFKSKEIREYMKMYKRHRKTMIKLAKEDADWDFCFLHNLVVTKLKHMYEYYSAGNHVWQSEESLKKVLETLGHAIYLADKIDNAWEDNAGYYCNKEDELYKEFYSYIGEYIRWWWD